MGNSFIGLPRDQNGKRLRTRTVTEGNEVHDEVVRISNQSDVLVNPATEETLQTIPGLAIPLHDYIEMSYDGSNLIGIIYKTGGASGTTVATLTLEYSGSNLISVTKS